MGSKTPTPKRIEVHCTNMFKDRTNISESISKLWAEVINALENNDTTEYNVDIQGYANQIPKETEVATKKGTTNCQCH